MDTRKIIFSSVGNVKMEEVIKLAEKYMGHIPKMVSRKVRTGFKGYKPKESILKRNVKQARCAIGRTAYKFSDEKRGSFYMLTNILGGAGMNSRLNMILREKRGYVYSVAAQFVPYTDTGLFVISFGTEPAQMKKSIDLVHLELKKMREEPLGKKQLAASKEQIMGQIAMAEENNISFMMMMARNLLDLGRVNTLEEIFERVRNTSSSKLMDWAGEMFNEEKLSYLFMEPKS